MEVADAPRRILFAATGIFTGGGIASVNRSIVRALEEERGAGRLDAFDTVSLVDDPDGAPPSERGAHRYARGSQLRFALQLWRAIRCGAPDLVLFDHAGLARVMRLPLPGLAGQAYAIFGHGNEIVAIRGGLRRAAFEGSSRVLTNSSFTARDVRERFPVLAGRVRPVLLCIEPEKIASWESELPDRPSGRQPAVLIVGRLWASERGKGHDALIAALPRVRERVADAQLWIVGTGDDAPRLERAVHERGLDGAVRFLGSVSDQELGRLYRTAGVFAMPSRQEGFGLVYAEAMWHGLPCIGSTLDAAREVITDGETGLLVPYDAPEPLADAIVLLLSDRERAAGMGRAASADARRRFTYARFRDDLLAALGLLPSSAA